MACGGFSCGGTAYAEVKGGKKVWQCCGGLAVRAACLAVPVVCNLTALDRLALISFQVKWFGWELAEMGDMKGAASRFSDCGLSAPGWVT
jgi:hypothetical protein